MKPDQTEAFYALSTSVRSLFHKLGNAVTALHEGSGVSVGMRAVMENVVTDGPKTVPQMARVRPVSRQHIQSLVNELLDAGYVKYVVNPAHRRSRLVEITTKGREVFMSLRARELEALSSLPVKVTTQELVNAGYVLAALIERFQSNEWQSIVNDLSPNSKE